MMRWSRVCSECLLVVGKGFVSRAKMEVIGCGGEDERAVINNYNMDVGPLVVRLWVIFETIVQCCCWMNLFANTGKSVELG